MSAIAMLYTGFSALGTQYCCCKLYNTTNGLTTRQPSFIKRVRSNKVKRPLPYFDYHILSEYHDQANDVLTTQSDLFAVQKGRTREAAEDKQRFVLLVHL